MKSGVCGEEGAREGGDAVLCLQELPQREQPPDQQPQQ